MFFSDPYSNEDASGMEEDSEDEESTMRIPPMVIDIDLALTSYSNAKK